MDRPVLKTKLISVTKPRVRNALILRPDGEDYLYGVQSFEPVNITAENEKELRDEIRSFPEYQKWDFNFQCGTTLWKFQGCYGLHTVHFDHVQEIKEI